MRPVGAKSVFVHRYRKCVPHHADGVLSRSVVLRRRLRSVLIEASKWRWSRDAVPGLGLHVSTPHHSPLSSPNRRYDT